MAELLGIVSEGAGLASLALQLGGSVAQLKRLHKSYKHAPEMLRDRIEEIETRQILLGITQSEGREHDLSRLEALDRCLCICSTSVRRIDAIIKKMDAAFKKPEVWGRLRTVVEEKEIYQLCCELQRSIGTLILAYQLSWVGFDDIGRVDEL